MDRAGRVIVVWIVGCMIPGVGLIAANAAVAGQAMTEPQIGWTKLGLFLIGLGAVAIAVEFVLVMEGIRHRHAGPTSLSPQPKSPDPMTPELAEARSKLAKLESEAFAKRQDERLAGLGYVLERARGLVRTFEMPDIATRTTKANAFAQLEDLDREVIEIIGDESADVEYYINAPRGPMVWSALEWPDHVAALATIRQRRIEQLRGRLLDRLGKP